MIINIDNLTTLAFAGLSLAGLIITKKYGLYYQGFILCLGAIPAVDYFQRR
jgi:hypothetical protein